MRDLTKDEQHNAAKRKRSSHDAGRTSFVNLNIFRNESDFGTIPNRAAVTIT